MHLLSGNLFVRFVYLVSSQSNTKMDEMELRSNGVSDSNNVLEVYDGVCSLEDEDPVPLSRRPGQ